MNTPSYNNMRRPWLSIGPDDSPLLLKDTETQNIYALEWEAPGRTMTSCVWATSGK